MNIQGGRRQRKCEEGGEWATLMTAHIAPLPHNMCFLLSAALPPSFLLSHSLYFFQFLLNLPLPMPPTGITSILCLQQRLLPSLDRGLESRSGHRVLGESIFWELSINSEHSVDEAASVVYPGTTEVRFIQSFTWRGCLSFSF